MLKAAQNNLREQSSSCDLRREVEGGPRTNLPDDLPRATPLAWARHKGHGKVEQMLTAAGATSDGFSDQRGDLENRAVGGRPPSSREKSP